MEVLVASVSYIAQRLESNISVKNSQKPHGLCHAMYNEKCHVLTIPVVIRVPTRPFKAGEGLQCVGRGLVTCLHHRTLMCHWSALMQLPLRFITATFSMQKPCEDPRHKEIWPSWKPCNRFPSFLIVGPQKTGTTALHMFLSAHPEVRKNNNNEKSYEETQFFASSNYFKGVDWYVIVLS